MILVIVTLRASTPGTGLRRALAAYALYGLVEYSVWLAIILFAYIRGGAPLAALVAVVQLVPAALIGPLLAGLADRMPRGRALAAAHAGVAMSTALTALSIGAGADVPVVIVFSAFTTIAIAVVRPLHFATLPRLALGPGELVSANSLSSVADAVAVFTGPALAGFGAQLAGPGLVFTGATAAGVMASLLCFRLGPAGDAATPEPGGSSAARDAASGLRELWRDGGALALLLVLATTAVIGGALDVLGVSFSEAVLGQGQSGAGLIIGALGIGELAGAVVAGWLSRRRHLASIVVAGGVLQGAAIALVVVFEVLTPAMAAIALAGIGGALLMVAGRTLLQRAIDDQLLARVFAVQEGTSLLGIALGAAVAPGLIGIFSPGAAFVPLGLAAAVLTIAGGVLIRRLDARAVWLPEELALLRGVPFLSVLPPYDLERLARHARWDDVTTGSVVVRQGEPGDEFFVIAEGEFSVTVDGLARTGPVGPDGVQAGSLGPGAGFGEIALLQAVPRTATVTARTPGRLLAVRSQDFLAAVTGSEDGGRIAADVAAAHLARDRARRG